MNETRSHEKQTYSTSRINQTIEISSKHPTKDFLGPLMIFGVL